MITTASRLAGISLLLVGTVAVTAFGEKPPAGPPDLTQDRQVDRARTYNLGATGMRGWIYTKPATYFDSVQGRTTAASRQILVTHVGKNSPADGVLQVDDVILGVGGKRFDSDARKSIALAIQDAEKASHRGILRLTRWQDGRVQEVQLKLRVMGTYSDTAPYECHKSRLIFEDACKVLAQEPLKDNLFAGAINGLALMATGRPEYLPSIRELARRMAPRSLKLPLKNGMFTWDWGYRNLFLCEYYLLTGDQEVLPAITEYTMALAKGQSLFGTFGHGIAPPTPDGTLHGSIPPYGPVNAAGLVANVAIVLGKHCGVKHVEIESAIERASRFFGYFVDKGTIPYGEHEPWPYHENNGKSAMAAVLFALQGNKIAETQFFAKMSVAAFKNREYGHTGQGFSYLWGALGANIGGPTAVAAFFKEASWHFDLVRRCDGSFTYDGGEQYGPGKTDDNTYYGKSGYYGLSPTATYVLTYALPLRKLYITGRIAPRTYALSDQDVAEAVAAGHFDLARTEMTDAQLIQSFDNWSPVVRGWAADELAKRPDARTLVPRLIALAKGPNVHVAQGACETLGYTKVPAALPMFIDLLSHDDRWLRFKAARALDGMGGEARPVVRAMLQAVAATTAPADSIDWKDPIQLPDGQLAKALFAGPLRGALQQADRELVYAAVRAVARNPDGMARATLRGFFENWLTAEDVQALAPDLLLAVKVRCPADTMFGNEIRMGGFKALTKYHFREGLEAGVAFARTQGGHGSESRTGEIMREISTYGSAAREVIPDLKALIEYFNAECKAGGFPAGDLNQRRVGAVEVAIRSIEAATTHPELRSLSRQTASPQSADNRALRAWKDATGKYSIEAQFLEQRGDRVTFKKTDGSRFTVPLKKLSQADQDWLRQHRVPQQPTARVPSSGSLSRTTPLKVFVLAGQSNMEGQAVVDLDGKNYNDGKGTLKKLLQDPAKATMLKHLVGADGQCAVRNDVWVWYKTERAGLKTGPLTVGFTGYGDKHHFGPELQFGHVVGNYCRGELLLIKTAWGGKSLCKDFRPPSSGGEVGPYYTKMLAEIREALANLKQAFPAYDERGYELAGFVWYQGWNDGCTRGAVPEYERNLVNLIHDVRKDLGVPKLPVVVGELTGPWVQAQGDWAALRQAQAAAAARPEFRGTVRFVPTHDFVRKPEDSPNPTHGHHEFGNAETYFLVGDALGKGMTSLLGASK